MPKRKSRIRLPRWLGLLAAAAVLVFAIGEGFRALRSDAGHLVVARTLGFGDDAELVRIVGGRLRAGLATVGVPDDSLTETVLESGARMRWRVGLGTGASLLQVNYALTRSLEDHGATVISASERWADDGSQVLRMLVGLPRRTTHEVLVVRHRAGAEEPEKHPGRVAVVLYGFSDDAAQADSFFTLEAPFAVAVIPGSRGSERVLLHARQQQREVVLHLPLEPINYPSVNPGPGTLLVSMPPRRIASTVNRYLDQAGTVAAVSNHMGSLATQDMTVMSAIYKELKKRRLPFLHVNPAAGAVCKSLAADMGLRYAEPDEILDGEARKDAKALDRRWAGVLREAQTRGRLIVLVRATPLTRTWLPRALATKRLDGVSIVPLTSLLEKPAAL